MYTKKTIKGTIFLTLVLLSVMGAGCKNNPKDAAYDRCSKEERPVCGEIEQCQGETCIPFKKNFFNRCFAEVEGAKSVVDGECPGMAVSPVSIVQPVANSVVKSPLRVVGSAKGTWFFEGQMPIELRDNNNNSLANGVVKAQGNWMTEQPVSFVGTLQFKVQGLESGFVIIKKDNPSGIVQDDEMVTIPVRFK